jgi:hypothetical protein
MKVASSSDSTHGTTTRGDDADSTLSRLPAITCLGRRCTPRNQCKQRGLHRQAHDQRPVRNAKQRRILQHVDVCWRHRQRQDEQANTCRAARLAPKQPGSNPATRTRHSPAPPLVATECKVARSAFPFEWPQNARCRPAKTTGIQNTTPAIRQRLRPASDVKRDIADGGYEDMKCSIRSESHEREPTTGQATRGKSPVFHPNTTMLCLLNATGSPRGPHSITP